MVTSFERYRTRISALPKARLLFSDHALRCKTFDLSRKGALLGKGRSSLIQYHLAVRLLLSGVQDAIDCCVVFHDSEAIGLQFIAPALTHLEDIEALIIASGGYPELLDRDVHEMVSTWDDASWEDGSSPLRRMMRDSVPLCTSQLDAIAHRQFR